MVFENTDEANRISLEIIRSQAIQPEMPALTTADQAMIFRSRVDGEHDADHITITGVDHPDDLKNNECRSAGSNDAIMRAARPANRML